MLPVLLPAESCRGVICVTPAGVVLPAGWSSSCPTPCPRCADGRHRSAGNTPGVVVVLPGALPAACGQAPQPPSARLVLPGPVLLASVTSPLVAVTKWVVLGPSLG